MQTKDRPQPSPAPARSARPRRSAGASAGWLTGWSLLAPVAVFAVGVLLYALKWLAAVGAVVATLGFIATYPAAERWITDVMSWAGFNSWMGGLVPWAAASLFVTLAVGGLTLALTRRTRASAWHPALQGLLAAAGGVAVIVLGLGATLLAG